MKILVGYRGANVGRDLHNIAAQHIKGLGGEVHVVTSLPGGEETSREDSIEAENTLKAAKEYMDGLAIPCTTHLLVRNKTAGEDLVAFAKDNECDEIVIGVKSRSKIGKILFGSTSQYVILKAHCPVVTVK